MKFEKTNSQELEKTITIVLCITLLLIQAGSFVQSMHIYTDLRVELGSIALAFGACMLLMFDIMMLTQKEYCRFTLVEIVMILSLISIGISYYVATEKDIAISGYDLHSEGVPVLVSYLIVFYSATFIKDRKNFKAIYYCLTVLAVFEVALGVVQAVIQPGFMRDILDNLYFESYRAYGTIENPNTYGSFLALFLGLETMLFYHAEGKKTNVLHAVLIIVYSFGLFLSGTRGAMVGYGFTALTFVAALVIKEFRGEKKVGKVFSKIGIIILCCIAGILIAYLCSRTTFNDVANRINSDSEAVSGSIENLGNERVKIWKKAWDKFIEKPVFGVGISGLSITIFMSDFLLTTPDAHNRYLQMLCTQGVAGLLIYLFMHVIVVINVIKIIKAKDEKRNWVVSILFAYCAYSVADLFCIGSYALAPYFYLAMGLMIYRKNSCEVSENV